VLFRPDLIGEESEGLHEVLLYSIQKSDLDLRQVLYQNIVLSGGSTLFKVIFVKLNVCYDSLMHNFRVLVIDFWQNFASWHLRILKLE
jgi:actin-related protein